MENNFKDLCLGYDFIREMYNDEYLGVCHECLVKRHNESLALTFARNSLTGQTFFELSKFKGDVIVGGHRLMNPVNIKDHNEMQEELTKIQESSQYKNLLLEFQIDNDLVSV